MNNPEIECVRCHYQCDWVDVEKVDGIAICPECNSADSFANSFVETDGVDEDDYRDQNPLDVPRE